MTKNGKAFYKLMISVNGFPPNQLVFGKNPNFPNVSSDNLPALENKSSSEVVTDNLNALHSARQNFIKSEASSKLKQALKHQTRSYTDVIYNTGDIVYYKRKDNLGWSGPGTVIGWDAQQILVKHGSTYIRVYPCNLQLKGNTFVTKNNSSSTPDVSNGPTELRKNSNEFHQDSKQSFENASVLYETEKECEVDDDDAINSETNSEINIDTNEYYNGLNKPKVKDFVEYKVPDSDKTFRTQIISRAGKISGKYSDWFNMQDLDDGSISNIDWNSVEKWKPFTQEEVLLASHKNHLDFELQMPNWMN